MESRDRRTIEALADTGRWLGYGIGNLINVFNPELIVVGGLYQQLFPYLHESLEGAARSVILAAPGGGVRIVAGSLGVDASLLGASELALSRIVADPASVQAIERPPDMADGA